MAWAPLALRPGHAAPPLRSPARLAAPSPLAIAVGTWKPAGAPPTHPRAGPAPPLRSPAGQIPLPRHRVAPRPARVVQLRSLYQVAALPRSLRFPHRRVPITPSHISGRRTTASCLGLSHLRFAGAPLGASGRSLRSLSALAVVRTQPLIVPPTTLRYVGSTPFAALTLAVHTTQAGNAPWKHKHAAWARRKISTGIAGLCTALRGSAWAAPAGGVPPCAPAAARVGPGRLHAHAPVPARSSRYALHSLRLTATLAPASLPARRVRRLRIARLRSLRSGGPAGFQ